MMTLDEILQDIRAMEEDLLTFERKYGLSTDKFYQSYQNGEEPEDDAWVLDWSEWAGTYQILLQRQEMYQQEIEKLSKDSADGKLLQGDCQIPAPGLDLAIQAEQNSIY